MNIFTFFPIRFSPQEPESLATAVEEPSLCESLDPLNALTLGIARFLLSLLTMLFIDSHPSSLVPIHNYVGVLLGLYCVYSAVVLVVHYYYGVRKQDVVLYWLDALFAGVMIPITQDVSHVFSVMFVLAVFLISRTYQGTDRHYRMPILLIGVAFSIAISESDSLDLLPHISYFVTVVSIAIYWGSHELTRQKRIEMIHDINMNWDPRFGLNRTIGENLNRLLAFYQGDSCILVLPHPNLADQCVVYSSVARQEPGHAAIRTEMSQNATEVLLSLPEEYSASYCSLTRHWWSHRKHCHLYKAGARMRTREGDEEHIIASASLLDANAFITVPYRQYDGTHGRFYITASTCTFLSNDIKFLSHVSRVISTIVDNVHLMENSLAQSIQDEHKKIYLDLHDTTIQPYIGLKIAIEALARDTDEDHPLAKRLADLVDMTSTTVRDLRRFALSIKEASLTPCEFLLSSVNRLADRVAKHYGIHIEVRSGMSMPIKSQLAAEVFQIISEGISNIMRHTSAKTIDVHIRCENERLLLDITNQVPHDPRRSVMGRFVPRSIHERALLLGGSVSVEPNSAGYTIVRVVVPIK